MGTGTGKVTARAKRGTIGRQDHTNYRKLRMLNNKVKTDYLVTIKTNIEMQMNMVPMNMIYSTALIKSFQIQMLTIKVHVKEFNIPIMVVVE